MQSACKRRTGLSTKRSIFYRRMVRSGMTIRRIQTSRSEQTQKDIARISVSERPHPVAQFDVDQTIEAKRALSLFPIDAQRRQVASRIIIEAISAGKLDMMCKVIVTEVKAKPVRMNAPTELDRLTKNIEDAGSVFLASIDRKYRPDASPRQSARRMCNSTGQNQSSLSKIRRFTARVSGLMAGFMFC